MKFKVRSIMKKVSDQVENIIEQLDIVSDHLYQQKLSKGFELFNSSLLDITKLIEVIYLLTKDNKVSFDINRLTNNLNFALQALEDKDSVLLADILTFEISGQLQELII